MSAAAAKVDPDALFRYVLRLGDLSLVLGQRLGEWVGHSPALEEDLGLANIALDLIGQARLLLTYAGEIEGRGRDEDKLAYLREQGAYFNAILAEQPNGDFGQTIVRQVLIDAFQLELYERLAASRDERLAAIAAKSVKEVRYHLRYSSDWLVRLGDGTAESHARVQSALELLWPYTVELFAADELDRLMAESGIATGSFRGSGGVERAHRCHLERGDVEAARGSSACLAWQARPTQRASGLHPRRDAVSAAHLSGRALVSSVTLGSDQPQLSGNSASRGARGGGLAVARVRGRS